MFLSSLFFLIGVKKRREEKKKEGHSLDMFEKEKNRYKNKTDSIVVDVLFNIIELIFFA
jgi:hypothetical protein